jgi:hypothetical protein
MDSGLETSTRVDVLADSSIFIANTPQDRSQRDVLLLVTVSVFGIGQPTKHQMRSSTISQIDMGTIDEI